MGTLIMNITFLGQGAMGSRMADRLDKAGFALTRWNRSGAKQSPREAVANADIVIAMLRDDEASRAVWLNPETGALAGMKADALAIESSTLSVDFVRELDVAMKAANHAFIDAPVLGSRPQAEAAQLIYLIGGATEHIDRAQPVLAAMGGKQLVAGSVSAGAALKLVANMLFGVQVAAIAELIGRITSLGLEPAKTIEQLGDTPLLSPAAAVAASLMLADKRDPMFPIMLVSKDFGYAIGDAGAAMPVATATRGVFETAIAEGLGDANLTAVSALYAVN